MKKLGFYFNVPDKYTGATYKEYDEKKKGPTYDFEDKRADEILNARTRVTGEPFAFEIVEEEIVEPVEKDVLSTEEIVEAVDIDLLKVSELKEIAKIYGIKGYDKMKKAELIEALTKNAQ